MNSPACTVDGNAAPPFPPRDARWMRVAEIVGAVARQALADRGLDRIALLDDGGAQASLAAGLLIHALGEGVILRVADVPGDVEPLLPSLPHVPPDRARAELRRLRARLMDGALPADPACKTGLLLAGDLPPEPLLPLGDLWATDVIALGGEWTVPADIAGLVDAAGGIDALDAALRRVVDGRDPGGLTALPDAVAGDVRRRLAAGAASRRNPRLVPKLGGRTLGVDLFE